MESNQTSKIAELEALLFLHGEPLSHKKIATVLNIKEEECSALVEELKKRLEADDRGLHIVSDKEKVQLATKPAMGKLLEEFVKEELTEELTAASLEALAIVAYLGPISRAKIEYLRGVNSIVILRSLMLRGLVERLPDPGHASGFVYKATFDFIKHLGLQESRELPDFEKFQKLLEVFEKDNGSPPVASVAVQTVSEPATYSADQKPVQTSINE
jgi:segregation and condensation protein B